MKDIATEFLILVADGRIDDAFEKYADPHGKHHNVHTAPGFDALREGMKENEARFPNKQFTVQQVIGEGDKVVTYSHLVMKPGLPGLAVMHMFRITDDKIVELWDCGQAIPEDSPNSDGPF